MCTPIEDQRLVAQEDISLRLWIEGQSTRSPEALGGQCISATRTKWWGSVRAKIWPLRWAFMAPMNVTAGA